MNLSKNNHQNLLMEGKVVLVGGRMQRKKKHLMISLRSRLVCLEIICLTNLKSEVNDVNNIH